MNGTTKGTASIRRSTISQPTTRKKPYCKRAGTSVRLFVESLIRNLQSTDLFVFKSSAEEVDGRYDMLLVVGDDKVVVARDRIAKLVLVPSTSESNNSCMRETLWQIVAKAAAARQTLSGLGQTTTGVVIVTQNYSSNVVSRNAKHRFLKAIAYFLTREYMSDGSGPSIWLPCFADKTPQCWDVRITKLRLRAKRIFEDIAFPPHPRVDITIQQCPEPR
jgi:hypothetical protein